MRLIVDQSLATDFIPINTQQHRASLPVKPSVLERKVYNDEGKTFFAILKFAKPSWDNVLQPSPLHCSGCNTLFHEGLANINKWKRMFYPLMCKIMYNPYRLNIDCHHILIRYLETFELKPMTFNRIMYITNN